MSVSERVFLDAVVSDVLKTPPVLLITDCSPTKQGFGKTQFDYIEYFRRDQRFAEIWTEYRFLRSVDNYRVFKRTKGRAVDAGKGRTTAWRRDVFGFS